MISIKNLRNASKNSVKCFGYNNNEIFKAIGAILKTQEIDNKHPYLQKMKKPSKFGGWSNATYLRCMEDDNNIYILFKDQEYPIPLSRWDRKTFDIEIILKAIHDEYNLYEKEKVDRKTWLEDFDKVEKMKYDDPNYEDKYGNLEKSVMMDELFPKDDMSDLDDYSPVNAKPKKISIFPKPTRYTSQPSGNLAQPLQKYKLAPGHSDCRILHPKIVRESIDFFSTHPKFKKNSDIRLEYIKKHIHHEVVWFIKNCVQIHSLTTVEMRRRWREQQRNLLDLINKLPKSKEQIPYFSKIISIIQNYNPGAGGGADADKINEELETAYGAFLLETLPIMPTSSSTLTTSHTKKKPKSKKQKNKPSRRLEANLQTGGIKRKKRRKSRKKRHNSRKKSRNSRKRNRKI